MTTADLYESLRDKFQLEPFVLRSSDLEGLSSQVDVAAAIRSIRCYFAEGAIQLTGRTPVSRPGPESRIEVIGVGTTTPFAGMALRLELWTEPKAGSGSELHLAVSACGAASDALWTLGQAIPFYQDSLLGGLRFAVSNDPQCPFLTLSSHPGRPGTAPSLLCKGFVDLNSIAEASPSLFLGSSVAGKYAVMAGTIAAFAPFTAGDGRDFRPFLSLYSGLPDLPQKSKLGGLFPIGNIRYALNAKPDYNFAANAWEAECSFLWSAEMELKPATGGDNAAGAYKLPIGVEIKHEGGRIRIWTDLTDGLALAWDALAGIIPGFPQSLPETGFQLRDAIKLTNLQFIADRTADRGLALESISLEIETKEDTNQWVLIEDLLTLDAIDFLIVVSDPLGTSSVYLCLTGLFAIGEKATLSLTADLSHAGDETDYGFSGRLLDDEPLEINEVLTHFLGHSNYPKLPKITVEDFSFSVRPRSKFYEGEIKLSTDWKLSDALSLRGVFFRMRHGPGEADTEFEANGYFEVGDTQLYVSADYVSNGRGWTFSGGTFDDEEIEVGEWFCSMWALASQTDAPALPNALKELVVLNLGVRINPTTKEYSFQGTGRFPIDGNADSESNAELTIQVDCEGDLATFSGSLSLLEREFDVVFDNTGLLVATYDGSDAKPIDLKELASEISKTVGDKIAAGITVGLEHAQLAYLKGAEDGKFLFGVDLDAGIQLSNLPVVGFLFNPGQSLNVTFQFIAVSRAFESDEIKAINQLTGPETTKLPEQRIGGVQADQPDFTLKAAVKFAGTTQHLALPLNTDVGAAPASKKLPVTSGGGMATYWVKIDKALGPFHFQRLGIGTDSTKLALLLDASLQTAGLTIMLDGLEASCTFADLKVGTFQPSFELRGLGIAFKSGDLEIGGALVHRPAPAKDAYDGAVVIRYKRLGIEAVGSYETVDGHPALFIYALIDYPLGGPAFFFVEGGALGFGYNRTFTMPSIDKVSEFPLVKQALSPGQSRLTPMELAGELRPYIAPAPGQYFIAVGVKFTSFKTIKGFVLLTVLFGDHFEIDVLGKATLTSPPGAESGKALMSATLMLLGRFQPEQGLLMVMAQLGPDARLFAPDCHLSGGFALYCWFDGKNKGDFVLTLGGYHKAFAVPGHYPKVPRLAMNWQVNPNLSLKAEAYFALTPSALMAGGKLEANWQSGDLQAWFRVEVDFLIGWQPFYYNGHAYIAIGARYRFEFFGKHEISAELTAELDIWGPPFSGRARVQWNLISFELAFGDKEPRPPEPLDWPAFRKSFLPEGRMFIMTAETGKVAQGRGNARTEDAASLGWLNPRTLCIAVRSPLPIKDPGNDLLKNALELPRTAPVKEPKLGIAPMNKKATEWKKSLVTITIVRVSASNSPEDVTGQFQATRIRDNVPASLWGETMDPKARKKDDPQLLNDAICGYEIRLLNPVNAGSSTGFTVTTTVQNAAMTRAAIAPAIKKKNPGNSADEIADSLFNAGVRKKRGAILNDLLPETDVEWGTVTIAAWRGTPSIVKSLIPGG